MQQAAAEAGVQIIAGDTKVVQKNKADGLYITTTGIGIIPSNVEISGSNAVPGDVVIVSGSIGEHGIAVLIARGELGIQANIQSDVAPLNKMVQAIIKAAPSPSMVHVLRDPTRGGLGTTLNEIARQSQACIDIKEELIPIQTPVRSACELLGFDPLYIANEGKLVVIVAPEAADAVIMAMRNFDIGKQASVIGRVAAQPAGKVLLKNPLGTTRIIEMLSGEMLPRIC
jgi:hydrogenase expression/formation protein HypE